MTRELEIFYGVEKSKTDGKEGLDYFLEADSLSEGSRDSADAPSEESITALIEEHKTSPYKITGPRFLRKYRLEVVGGAGVGKTQLVLQASLHRSSENGQVFTKFKMTHSFLTNTAQQLITHITSTAYLTRTYHS